MRGGDIPEIQDEFENEDELDLSEIPLTCTELLVLKKLYGYTTENADTLQLNRLLDRLPKFLRFWELKYRSQWRDRTTIARPAKA